MSRAIRRAALPLCSAIDKRWKKCLISMAGDFPHRRASRVAIILRKEVAAGSHPPKDSTTRGWKKTPCARQFSKCSQIFEVLANDILSPFSCRKTRLTWSTIARKFRVQTDKNQVNPLARRYAFYYIYIKMTVTVLLVVIAGGSWKTKKCCFFYFLTN